MKTMKTMKTMKVVGTNDARVETRLEVFDFLTEKPQIIYDLIHKWLCEGYGYGNDCSEEWVVCTDDEDGNSNEWLTKDEEAVIDKWLLDRGADHGETVMITHGW